jgi:HEAT repeat protein
MLPILLARAGYEEKPPAKPAREILPVLFTAVPLLAELRKNGEAPDLDKIAADERQNSAIRLTCYLALRRAGDDLNTKAVLQLFKEQKKLDRRIVAVLLLGYCRDPKETVPALLEVLDDPNRHLRAAVISTLDVSRPKEALPKLRKLLERGNDDSVYAVLRLVGEIGTAEGQSILADYLKGSVEGGSKGRQLSYALRAFQQATGKRWTGAGAHNDEYYRTKAREALAWWKDQK